MHPGSEIRNAGTVKLIGHVSSRLSIGAIGLTGESPRYFDLPLRLHAKHIGELIDADNEHFALVDRFLRRAADEQSQRLDHLLNSPGGIGQASMDRDLEIHRVSDRLRMLRRFSVDACLGRIELDSGELLYIGRLGLTDAEGVRLLYDWRSPAAEPFFAATHANPQGVATRRRYRWQRGAVVDYWDEAFTAAALVEHQGALDDQSAFIASLGSTRSPQMRDVLATIASDQDAIIRAESTCSLVVDGGPGTGKTVVALHRAAYLLYADPRVDRRRGGVLVVGPHQPYLSYVADVLPSLGEDGVQTCTLAEIVVEGVHALPEADREVARLKSSVAMIEAVEAAVQFYEEPPRQPMLVTTDMAEIWLSVDDWASAFEAPGPAAAHNEVHGEIRDELVAILLDKVDEEIDEDGNIASTDELRGALTANEELNDVLNRAWPMLEPTEVIADLWSVPAYLRRCNPSLTDAEVKLLTRPTEAPWTESDLPLLDAARRRLGDAHLAEREREHAKTIAAEREHIERIVDDFSAEAEGDEYGTGLVTMLRGEDFVDALIDQAGLVRPEPDALAGPFAHIIVDEAQELTDAQWQMLIARCPSRSFTIVGDRAQARHGFTETWRQRLERVGLSEVREARLSLNYRTPAEIMAVAEPAIRSALPDANVPQSVRSNGQEVVYGSISDLDSTLADWLESEREGTACVIGRSQYASTNERVVGLTPELAKGLEFDLVVLVNPAEFGNGIEGSVDRYVAMTRATAKLVILTD